jgi:hypothetical protein
LGYHTQYSKKRTAGLYHTTGFARQDIVELCVLVRAGTVDSPENVWPPVLGLFKSVVVALTYMRRNRVQVELAERFGVSQSTISRAITGVTPVLGAVLAEYVPTADDLDDRTQYVVDGTLLPCWSWACRPGLYSGKHKTTGMNVQVACTLTGRLAWISDPIDGSRHDTYCLTESGVLRTLDPRDWMGDKGYVGNDMITPIKKPAHRDPARLGEGIQQADQQDPLGYRASHRELQDLENHAHRLSAPAQDLEGYSRRQINSPSAACLHEGRSASRKNWVTTLNSKETDRRECIIPPGSPGMRSWTCV